MSKQQPDLPQRLRAVGATPLERRLLDAASREQPSHELSERMAQAIGISLSAPGGLASGGAKTGTAASTATHASSSIVPWLSGALVAACIAAGAYVATRSSAQGAAPAPVAPTPAAASVPSLLASSEPTRGTDARPADSPPEPDDPPAKTTAPQRGRRTTNAGELANQIALVDAARSALAAGNAQRALAIVREYQSDYPSGTFRPEVAAVKIEALVKLGRMSEARTLAERFVVAYGPGPLAERVTHLAHLAEP